MQSDVIKQILLTAKPYPSIIRIILFGSRAKGNFHRTSDFDVCVYCKNEKELTNFYFDVEDKVDSIYKIDIVHYESLANDMLKQEIEENGIVLYECEG